ncbi:MAG: Mrr restriction system protein [Candidatus Shapirobacteria bacterium]
MSTKETSAKVLFRALEILKDNGNELPGREVVDLIEKSTDFTEWEKERYSKTGNVRWQSILHFHSVGAIKAGYLIKKNGVWYLTEEGQKAISLGANGLKQAIDAAYKKWNDGRNLLEHDPDTTVNNKPEIQKVNLDQLEDQALSQIESYVRTKNPYEFQDLVAALFRGMGYFTPFVSPKGKDHGIDIIAYKDPIGIEKPTVKIQCKHYPDNPIQSQEIQKLKGTLAHDEEVGIFVSSGRFSEGAKSEARTSKSHIELIDFSRMIELWKQFYGKLSDEDKNLLPLHNIYFLGTNE